MKRRERERERVWIVVLIVSCCRLPHRSGVAPLLSLSLSFYLSIYLSLPFPLGKKGRKKKKQISSQLDQIQRLVVGVSFQYVNSTGPTVQQQPYHVTTRPPQVPFILPLPISKTRSPLSGFYNIKQTAMISIDITTSGRMGQGRNFFRIYNFLF